MEFISHKSSFGISILLPPNFELLRSRLTERQTDQEDEIERRLTKAAEEVRHYQDYDYVVINDDFHEAVKELEAIILAEQCLPRRICMLEDDDERECECEE